jgi:predicted nucleotidyltransferase component of viral defense system
MIASEKAKQLVNKFYYVDNPIADNTVRAMDYIDAVKCAEICAKEVLTELNKLPSKDLSDLQYWGEIECELSLL